MKKKVLVVEDDTTLREFMESVFQEKGYDVIVAKEGNEGLHLATHIIPDVIILDFTMPKMNGMEVCRNLRQDKSTAAIPVIFLTAKDRLPDKLLGIEVGSTRYLTKPFDLDVLERTVEELILPSTTPISSEGRNN